MTTSTQTMTKDSTTPIKPNVDPMDGTFKKRASSIASSTITTLLGSLDDDDSSSCWEGDFNESFTPPSQAEDPCTLPQELEDFTCSSHSMDFHELLTPEQLHDATLQLLAAQQQQQPEEPCDSFHSSYNLGKSLGEGAFGTVHQCFEKQLDGPPPQQQQRQSFAVKAVSMDRYNHDEIEIMDGLRECPTITQIKDVFYEENQSFIVMEEMQGGELLDRISEKECYTERQAKILFKTLLKTVQYCHSKGIAHCDIKPENILLKYKDNDTAMQLADFGLAKRFIALDGRRQRLFGMNGSAEYAAPEVFNRPEDDDCGYDERCDIWSLGVVLYILLAGYAPFDAGCPYETIQKVGRGEFKFHRHYWQKISLEAKILIVKLLQVEPDERCSIEEALDSPWFDDISDSSSQYKVGEQQDLHAT